MKRVLILILFSTLTISLSAQDKDPQAGISWSKYDFTSHYTVKDKGGSKTLAANKRIFISNFQVTQIVVVNGNQSAGAKTTNMMISLTPIDLVAYRKVVDKLYRKLLDQLQAEGYTIVSDEEVANSEFAKKQHTGKSIVCAYAKEPVFDKDQSGNQVVTIFPTNKFIAANYKSDLQPWLTRLGKTIDANIISITLTINPVSFESDRKEGSLEGVSIEANANLTVTPSCLLVNEQGGFNISATTIDGKSSWVGPKGLSETDKTATVFGSVKGNYILDVNQREYLYEVEVMSGGAVKAFINTVMKEVKK